MRALWPVSDVLHALLLAAFALPLQACLVVISTGPTPLHDANIVFVVFDDNGGFVSGASVVVSDAGGHWQQSGYTGKDGVYRCSLGSGVTRVTITLEPPRG